MALTYLSSTLSEEEYLEQRFKQAVGTGRVTRAAINNSKYFCKAEYNRELVIVMADIREEVLKTQHMDTALLFLQKLVTWSGIMIYSPKNACLIRYLDYDFHNNLVKLYCICRIAVYKDVHVMII